MALLLINLFTSILISIFYMLLWCIGNDMDIKLYKRAGEYYDSDREEDEEFENLK